MDKSSPDSVKILTKDRVLSTSRSRNMMTSLYTRSPLAESMAAILSPTLTWDMDILAPDSSRTVESSGKQPAFFPGSADSENKTLLKKDNNLVKTLKTLA